MRVEPYAIGSILYMTKRGARGMDITRDNADRDRFPALLFYLNDTHYDSNWKERISNRDLYEWPETWPPHDPLVHILAWTLMPNHIHLLLEEIIEGGVAKFSQRIFGSMTMHFNAKHKERGSLFQGAYRSRTIAEDTHLRYLAFYIQVKNVLELYPGGLKRALVQFDDAWEWAIRYPYSSLSTFVGHTTSSITNAENFRALFTDIPSFKEECRSLLADHIEHHVNDESLDTIILESW